MDIEKKVNDILAKNKLDEFPLDIVSFLQNEGFTIIKKDLGTTSGAIYVNPNENLKAIALNETECVARRRFTLAHEYGHYILHNGTGEVYAHRDNASSINDKRSEDEANEFAACLLMPKNKVIEAVKDLKFSSLKIMKVQLDFGVSGPAALVRLQKLRLING